MDLSSLHPVNVKTAWHGVERSPQHDQRIRDEILALRQAFPQLTDCRVEIEALNGATGARHYAVGVDVRLPQHQSIVRAAPAVNLGTALRGAFAAARRALESCPFSSARS